jgi:hypothetical protein
MYRQAVDQLVYDSRLLNTSTGLGGERLRIALNCQLTREC